MSNICNNIYEFRDKCLAHYQKKAPYLVFLPPSVQLDLVLILYSIEDLNRRCNELRRMLDAIMSSKGDEKLER